MVKWPYWWDVFPESSGWQVLCDPRRGDPVVDCEFPVVIRAGFRFDGALPGW